MALARLVAADAAVVTGLIGWAKVGSVTGSGKQAGSDAVTVRRAVPADLAGLLDLYRHLNPVDPALAPEHAGAAWQAMLASPGMTVFVAVAAGRLLASCTLVVAPNLTRAARPYAFIENVVTHADARRRGLGQAVLKAALAEAWAGDCYKVMLMSGRKDEATLRFYEAAGFERGSKTAFQIRRG